MKQILVISLIVLLCLSKTNYSAAQVNVNDSLALVDLYNSTDGAHWIDNTGWLTGPVNTWNGVELTGNRVTNLILGDNNLKGTIPSSIGNLTMLTAINMFGNQLTGTLPASFNRLHLFGIFLMDNQLKGKIPAFDSSMLGGIGLSGNQFTGTLPVFPHIEKIVEMDLDNNQFTGNIPEEYNELTSQVSIDIANNQLSGPIPASFAHFDLDNYVNVQNNHFNFDGLEYIIVNSTHNYFTYSSQQNIPITYTPQEAFGKLFVHAGGTLSNNTYQWYRNNSLYKTITGDSTFIPDAAGVYFVKVNNAIVTNLQLISDTITIAEACATPPVNTTTTNIQQTSATLNWGAAQGAISYQLKYKQAGTTFTTITLGNVTSFNLGGLSANTKYVWKVRTRCPLKFSPFTLATSFKTKRALAAVSQSNSLQQNHDNIFIYPNPTTNNLNVRFTSSKQTAYTITIFDIQGKILLNKTGAAISGNNNLTLDIHALVVGMYLLKLQYDHTTVIKKLVKE
jgi:hypothetical protein